MSSTLLAIDHDKRVVCACGSYAFVILFLIKEVVVLLETLVVLFILIRLFFGSLDAIILNVVRIFELLVSRLVQKLWMVLLINWAKKVIVKCLLRLPLPLIFQGFLTANSLFLQFLCRFEVVGSSKDICAKTVCSTWTIAWIIVFESLIAHL